MSDDIDVQRGIFVGLLRQRCLGAESESGPMRCRHGAEAFNVARYMNSKNLLKIDATPFIHPDDRSGLKELLGNVGFEDACKLFIDCVEAEIVRIENLTTKIRLGPKQLPKVYGLLEDVCAKLGIPTPQLYLKPKGKPEIHSYGCNNPVIVITTSLLDGFGRDECKAALAHECGHILCGHMPYRTFATFMQGAEISGAELIKALIDSNPYLAPLKCMLALAPVAKIALLNWNRKSEYSADRVAAYVMGDDTCVIKQMLRTEGGGRSVDNIDIDSLYDQIESVTSVCSSKAKISIAQQCCAWRGEYPFNATRITELSHWFKAERKALSKTKGQSVSIRWLEK